MNMNDYKSLTKYRRDVERSIIVFVCCGAVSMLLVLLMYNFHDMSKDTAMLMVGLFGLITVGTCFIYGQKVMTIEYYQHRVLKDVGYRIKEVHPPCPKTDGQHEFGLHLGDGTQVCDYCHARVLITDESYYFVPGAMCENLSDDDWTLDHFFKGEEE